MASANYDMAWKLWHDFHDEVKYRHRFFPSHHVLDKLAEIAKLHELAIAPGAIYYRARIIDDIAP